MHYLPHRAVIRKDKQTTRLRIVYDASAQSNNGPSLNQILHAGPSLLPLINEIMLRFRTKQVALVGDLEKAFLMVAVEECHKDFLRFLWINCPEATTPEIVIKRFCRLVFGLSPSPFLLNATLRHHVKKYEDLDSQFVKEFLSSLYVDDLSSGSDSVVDAFQLFLKSKLRMQEAGFRMRKWASNSEELMQMIKDHEISHEAPFNQTSLVQEENQSYTDFVLGGKHDINDEEEQKVLGLLWNHKTDKLSVDLSKVVENARSLPLTKRSVLSVVAQIYDPLGWITPVVIPMKILFQKLCIDKESWDSPLNEQHRAIFLKWIKDLEEVSRISVDRCYFHDVSGQIQSIQLHGFSDSSESAYAATVYLRVKTKADVKIRLLSSKSKVAPISGETTPRLELLGALLLARLFTSVELALKETIQIEKRFCWIDSMAALFWIKSTEREWKQFIQNRIDKVRKLILPEAWNFCPGRLNPADLPTRGVKTRDLKNSDIWWQGPKFLCESEEAWPKQPNIQAPYDQVQDELKAEFRKSIQKLSTNYATVMVTCSVEVVINPKNYGDVVQLFRITAYVLKFIRKLKSSVAPKLKTEDEGEVLTVDEINKAEMLWLQEIQKSIVNSQKFSQLKASLRLFVDENGLYRCGGRLKNAPLPFDSKFPVLIPEEHYVTELIIRSCHNNVMHNGVKDTLTELRQRYYVCRGRQVVKKFITKCFVARNLWKLGRVEELIMSEDSHVRGAIVRVARAGKPSVLLRRPVQCLYPLEVPHVKNSLPTNDIKIDRAGSDTKEFVADPVENVLSVENPRVRRTAAIEGELRRRYNNYEDDQA